MNIVKESNSIERDQIVSNEKQIKNYNSLLLLSENLLVRSA